MSRPSAHVHRPSRRRRTRGGALVEFALLNVVLIPLLLYGVFLMDAAYLKLDMQEMMVSGIWDWSTRNSETASSRDEERLSVQRFVRLVYADHTSAYESGTDPRNGGTYNVRGHLNSSIDHQRHHTGFGAHYSFRWVNGDTQFQCTLGHEDLSWVQEPGFHAYGQSPMTAGGRVRCFAEGYVYNYIVPRTFLPEFSQSDLTALEHRSGDHHQWQGGGGATANIVLRETAALSFNTWAATNGGTGTGRQMLQNADINGHMPNNPFFRRVDRANRSGAALTASQALVTAAHTAFVAEAARSSIMVVSPPGVYSPILPNISGTHLNARYAPEARYNSPRRQTAPGLLSGGGGGHQSTPYEDVNNDYRTQARTRRAYYMGCGSAERPGC